MIPSIPRPFAGVALVLALSASASGCADPLEEVELIAGPRVLGARVEVDGEPGRAAPAPGESARVRWLVAAPEPEVPLAWSFVACVASETNLGVPGCAGPAFALGESSVPAPGAPALDLSVPADVDPEETGRVTVLGVICPGSELAGSGESATCAGAGGLDVSLEFELARPDDVNSNPAFGTEPLLLDGTPWTEGSSASACAGSGLLEVPAGSGDHAIRVEVASDARDPLPVVEEFDPGREELRIAHFSTDGGLDRPFSALAADAPETAVEVAWRAPKSAPADGELARFWFVLRDLRGGSDFVERSLCVVP